MKQASILLIPILLGIAACTKSSPESATTTPTKTSLAGTWKYTEYYAGTGGSNDQWEPALPANQTVEFKANGRLSATVTFLAKMKFYELTDSSLITFRSGSNGEVLKMKYGMDATDGSLVLYPGETICICGCGDKFKRID